MSGTQGAPVQFGIVIEFDLPPADPPDDPPPMVAGELSQFILIQGAEKFQLRRMGDEVLGTDGQSLGDDTRHRLQRRITGGFHGSPLIVRCGGERRGGGRWFGVGGGLGGRFNFLPSAFFAFSDGLGPRSSGFFTGMMVGCVPSYG